MATLCKDYRYRVNGTQVCFCHGELFSSLLEEKKRLEYNLISGLATVNYTDVSTRLREVNTSINLMFEPRHIASSESLRLDHLVTLVGEAEASISNSRVQGKGLKRKRPDSAVEELGTKRQKLSAENERLNW